MNAKYHVPETCNKCGNRSNEFIAPSYEGCHFHETNTVCQYCGFEDYWAYGYFESGTEMVSKCKEYINDHGVLKEI